MPGPFSAPADVPAPASAPAHACFQHRQAHQRGCRGWAPPIMPAPPNAVRRRVRCGWNCSQGSLSGFNTTRSGRSPPALPSPLVLGRGRLHIRRRFPQKVRSEAPGAGAPAPFCTWLLEAPTSHVCRRGRLLPFTELVFSCLVVSVVTQGEPGQPKVESGSVEGMLLVCIPGRQWVHVPEPSRTFSEWGPCLESAMLAGRSSAGSAHRGHVLARAVLVRERAPPSELKLPRRVGISLCW